MFVEVVVTSLQLPLQMMVVVVVVPKTFASVVFSVSLGYVYVKLVDSHSVFFVFNVLGHTDCVR